MVWLTGGGNHSLSGAGSPGFGGVVYDGEQLVPEGVVFVSYNTRLGALGFLAHPALDAERPERISGNYGWRSTGIALSTTSRCSSCGRYTSSSQEEARAVLDDRLGLWIYGYVEHNSSFTSATRARTS